METTFHDTVGTRIREVRSAIVNAKSSTMTLGGNTKHHKFTEYKEGVSKTVRDTTVTIIHYKHFSSINIIFEKMERGLVIIAKQLKVVDFVAAQHCACYKHFSSVNFI